MRGEPEGQGHLTHLVDLHPPLLTPLRTPNGFASVGAGCDFLPNEAMGRKRQISLCQAGELNRAHLKQGNPPSQAHPSLCETAV